MEYRLPGAVVMRSITRAGIKKMYVSRCRREGAGEACACVRGGLCILGMSARPEVSSKFNSLSGEVVGQPRASDRFEIQYRTSHMIFVTV